MPENLWGYLLVGLVFFMLGRITVGRGERATRASTPAAPAPRPSTPPHPLELPADLDAEIRELIDHDNVIQAIKRYREQTGADLKTAKDAVFEYRERLRRRGLV
jgi:ribosomal protein L7/L12